MTDAEVVEQLEYNLKTVTAFLEELRRELPEAFGTVPAAFVQRTGQRTPSRVGLASERCCASPRTSGAIASVAPMLDPLESAKMKPAELDTDTTYSSGANIVACAERGVELVAPVQDPGAPAEADAFEASAEQQPAEPAVHLADAMAGNALFLLSMVAAGGPEADLLAPRGKLSLGLFSFDSTFHDVHHCPAGHEPSEQHVVDGQLIATFPATACAGCPLMEQRQAAVLLEALAFNVKRAVKHHLRQLTDLADPGPACLAA